LIKITLKHSQFFLITHETQNDILHSVTNFPTNIRHVLETNKRTFKLHPTFTKSYHYQSVSTFSLCRLFRDAYNRHLFLFTIIPYVTHTLLYREPPFISTQTNKVRHIRQPLQQNHILTDLILLRYSSTICKHHAVNIFRHKQLLTRSSILHLHLPITVCYTTSSTNY